MALITSYNIVQYFDHNSNIISGMDVTGAGIVWMILRCSATDAPNIAIDAARVVMAIEIFP